MLESSLMSPDPDLAAHLAATNEPATGVPADDGPITTIDQLLRHVAAYGGIAVPARLIHAPQELIDDAQNADLLLTVEPDDAIELYQSEHNLSRAAFAMIGMEFPTRDVWRANDKCRCCHEFAHDNHADLCPFADHLDDSSDLDD